MSRRRIIRRAGISVLTFVLVSVLAHWMIPSLLAWGVASNEQEEALKQVLKETGREGEEDALKEEHPSRLREHPSIVERFEEQVGALWGISLLYGLVAGALVWIPTAPKHLARHHRHARHRRSHARHVRRVIDE
jgi:hypothetical protein